MNTTNTRDMDLYVVDDDADTRRSLLMRLALRGNRVQAFESGEAFLASADLQRGGCAILDMRMDPGMSGLEVFDALLARDSPIVVLFLSSRGTIPLAVEATKKGAFGWLEKPCADGELLEKIDAALLKAAGAATKHRGRQAARLLWNKLTPREAEVMRLVAKALSNKSIARELACGPRAVETHRANGYGKLGISDTTTLDHFIRDNGL
jgi:FixJ family two-component response regulator